MKEHYGMRTLNQKATLSKMERVQIEGGRQVIGEVEIYNAAV